MVEYGEEGEGRGAVGGGGMSRGGEDGGEGESRDNG